MKSVRIKKFCCLRNNQRQMRMRFVAEYGTFGSELCGGMNDNETVFEKYNNKCIFTTVKRGGR